MKMSSITKEAAKMMRRKVPNGGNTWSRSLPSINVRITRGDSMIATYLPDDIVLFRVAALAIGA